MLSLWRACRPVHPILPLFTHTNGIALPFCGLVRHASSKPSFRSERLANTQHFQPKRPKRKEEGGDRGPSRTRDSGQRNRESYFRKRTEGDERPNAFRRPTGAGRSEGRGEGKGGERGGWERRREGGRFGEGRKFGADAGKGKYPMWKQQPTSTAKPTGLKRKLAGKIEYPAKQKVDEAPQHVAPKSPPPKVVRRGDVSETVTLPKKEGNSNLGTKTFQQLGLKPKMREVLQTMNISSPTLIQEMAIPAILRFRQDIVFAAQTGTGKTLAYLLPVAQRLKQEEENFQKYQERMNKEEPNKKQEETEEAEEEGEEGKEDGEGEGEGKGKKGVQALRPPNFRRREGRPRAIVLLPNRELAEQVGQVAKSISHVAKLVTEMVSGGSGSKKQYKEKLKSYLDILIATPGRLLKHLEDDRISLRDVGYVVLDEGDSLLAKGQGFDEDMAKLFKIFSRRMVKPLPEGEIPIQFIVVTATLTPSLVKSIKSKLPTIQTLVTPTIHKNLENLRQKFLNVVGGDKHEILKKLVTENQAKHTLVFCNTMDSARSTEYKLKEWGFDATILHGEVPPKVREQNWKHFRETPNSYLVCTDIASRGLDTTMVDYVINFDFPFNTIDYLHRVGRTARAGASGSVVSLLAKKDEALGTGIIYAVNKGLSLENVTADKKDNQTFFQKIQKERRDKILMKKGTITKPTKAKKFERPKKQKGSRRLLPVIAVRNKQAPRRQKRKSRKMRDTGAPY